MNASVGCTSGHKIYLCRSVFECLEIKAGVVWQIRIQSVVTNAMICVCLLSIGGLRQGDLGNLGKPNMGTGCEVGSGLAADQFFRRGWCAGDHVELDVLCLLERSTVEFSWYRAIIKRECRTQSYGVSCCSRMHQYAIVVSHGRGKRTLSCATYMRTPVHLSC